jgi:DNA-binding Lrp family transcriptional regulator
MTRIRFVGLASAASQPATGHPSEIAGRYLGPTAEAGKTPCFAMAFLLDCQGNRRPAMTPFFVQIKCELGKSYQVANALAEAEIASEIYSTAGDYDLLVKFYVDSATDIGHFVNEKVQTISGIKDTHTIITFKAFTG